MLFILLKLNYLMILKQGIHNVHSISDNNAATLKSLGIAGNTLIHVLGLDGVEIPSKSPSLYNVTLSPNPDDDLLTKSPNTRRKSKSTRERRKSSLHRDILEITEELSSPKTKTESNASPKSTPDQNSSPTTDQPEKEPIEDKCTVDPNEEIEVKLRTTSAPQCKQNYSGNPSRKSLNVTGELDSLTNLLTDFNLDSEDLKIDTSCYPMDTKTRRSLTTSYDLHNLRAVQKPSMRSHRKESDPISSPIRTSQKGKKTLTKLQALEVPQNILKYKYSN